MCGRKSDCMPKWVSCNGKCSTDLGNDPERSYETLEFIGTYVQGAQEWPAGQDCAPQLWARKELLIWGEGTKTT